MIEMLVERRIHHVEQRTQLAEWRTQSNKI